MLFNQVVMFQALTVALTLKNQLTFDRYRLDADKYTDRNRGQIVSGFRRILLMW